MSNVLSNVWYQVGGAGGGGGGGLLKISLKNCDIVFEQPVSTHSSRLKAVTSLLLELF